MFLLLYAVAFPLASLFVRCRFFTWAVKKRPSKLIMLSDTVKRTKKIKNKNELKKEKSIETNRNAMIHISLGFQFSSV